MRKLFTILVPIAIGILLTVSVFLPPQASAQTPEKMSYQAVIRDASDALVTNTQIGMQISILQGSLSGTVVYTETQTPTTNANGLVSIEIGGGTGFNTIDWSAGPYFIETETDPSGGTSYSISGTSQLLSVPYAMHAKTAEQLSEPADETDPVFEQSVAAGITSADTTKWNTPPDFPAETDPTFNAWDKSTGITITESQITDLTLFTGDSITGNEAAFIGWDKDVSDDFDGYYGSLMGRPTRLGFFRNDVGFITNPNDADADPSNELQILSISNDTIYLSNDGFAKLPAETDPVYTAWDKTSGISITESQISDLQSYLTTEVDGSVTNEIQVLSISNDTVYLSDGGFAKLPAETDPVYTAWDKTSGISITESQISDLDHFTTADETDPSVPTGTQTGQMQYWNGTAWVTVSPASANGQTLYFINNKPQWGPVMGANDVMNTTTGKIWMDRNLGASQVATSSTDAAAYGDLYQWGRAADGHESRTSGTTATLSTTDTPGHGNFITSGSNPYDWRSPQNDNLWQGVSGTNNPCPSGYRLPTEAEWEAERTSWGSNNAAGAFASPLKLPVVGIRYDSNGSLINVGSYGHYWSSTVDGIYSRYLFFSSSNASMYSNYRAYGFSVRCLKD